MIISSAISVAKALSAIPNAFINLGARMLEEAPTPANDIFINAFSVVSLTDLPLLKSTPMVATPVFII